MFSLVFIPWLGTLGAQQLLIAFSAAAGVAVLAGVLEKPVLPWEARPWRRVC